MSNQGLSNPPRKLTTEEVVDKLTGELMDATGSTDGFLYMSNGTDFWVEFLKELVLDEDELRPQYLEAPVDDYEGLETCLRRRAMEFAQKAMKLALILNPLP